MKRFSFFMVLLCALVWAPKVAAQSAELVEANRLYQAGDLRGARAVLDKLVEQPAAKNSPEAWVLRGFVYKDLYKGAPAGAEADGFREEALTSLLKSHVADSSKEFSQSSSQAYDFLCKTIFNDAARALNEMDDVKASALYATYKERVKLMDPTYKFFARDVEFNNALGTVMTKRFNQNREDTAWFNKAVELYERVLALDSNNYGANYNLATLYYNRGVYNIQRISVGTTIPDLRQIQDAAKSFFLKALPYMLKAHNMNPKRRETLLGLEGIHYSLQDVDKSEEYRHKYEALDQEIPPNGSPQQAPKDK
jgi:tetratricopeptide (TPR) repeat protein